MPATNLQQMILRLLKELQAAYPRATRKELAKLLAERISADEDALTGVAEFLVSDIRKSGIN